MLKRANLWAGLLLCGPLGHALAGDTLPAVVMYTPPVCLACIDYAEHLRNAVVATEDKRYYQHFGISPRGIASAVRINLSEGRGPLEGNGGCDTAAALVALSQHHHP